VTDLANRVYTLAQLYREPKTPLLGAWFRREQTSLYHHARPTLVQPLLLQFKLSHYPRVGSDSLRNLRNYVAVPPNPR
jgi:hypothetical protein